MCKDTKKNHIKHKINQLFLYANSIIKKGSCKIATTLHNYENIFLLIVLQK